MKQTCRSISVKDNENNGESHRRYRGTFALKRLLALDRTLFPHPIAEDHPEWIEIYWKSWEMALSNIQYSQKPGWKPYMACIPNLGIIWQWDSCFMAMFAKYSSGVISGMDNLDNLYRLQSKDGYISMAYVVDTEKPAYGERINPPLYAWVEWEYYIFTGDDGRLKKVFPILVKYYNWIKKNRRRTEDGYYKNLYYFESPGSSGMDNAPRGGTADVNGSDIGHVDLISQQALSAKYLALIANHLDKKKEETLFKEEFNALSKTINEIHWHDRTEFYYDVFHDAQSYLHCNWLNHKTIAGFWPMLAGVCSKTQVNGLIKHIVNPTEFWRGHPLPTLSADDPNYDSLGGYWLGGVWAPTNYMTVKGLSNYECDGLATEISLRHLNKMVETYKEYEPHTIWECYSPDFIRPSTAKMGNLARGHFVGWTGLGPIAMLIENILGINVNAPSKKVAWKIYLAEEHGIKNLPLGKGRIDLICRRRNSITEPFLIEVKSDVDFKLSVFTEDHRNEVEIRKGKPVTVKPYKIFQSIPS